jgi:hypothetical protein
MSQSSKSIHKTSITNNDENFLKEFLRNFHQKIINTKDFNNFENDLIEWIKNINNNDNKKILELIPDGTMRADYSWSYHGIPEWLLGVNFNPKLHLELTDTRTNQIVARYHDLGDMATIEEARERFHPEIPFEIPD